MVRVVAFARFAAGVVCLVGCLSVAWLAMWVTAVPVVRGWSPVAVMSGSMGPAIETGDVLIAAPPGRDSVGSGTVIVFDNPSGPGLVTHRVVAIDPAGGYVTRGDANPRVDSTPVAPDTIEGVGRVLVPIVGMPLVWADRGQWAHLVAAAIVGLAALWASRWAVQGRFNPWRPWPVASLPPSVEPGAAAVDLPPRHRLMGRTRPRRLAAYTTAALVVASLAIAAAALVRTNAAFANATNNTADSFVVDTLAPPTSLTATGTGPITLDWTATTDTYATGHRVYRSTTPGGPYTQIAEVTPPATTGYVDSPDLGTYHYVVRAYYLGWDSADSNEDTATAERLYLHNNPSPPSGDTASQDLLPLDMIAPTATTLYNYDTDRDGSAGRLVAKGAGLGETDPTKFQRWMHAPTSDLTLSTTARLTISSAMKDFASGKSATVEAGLYDCTTAGTACTLLGSGTTTQNPWPSTWQDVSIDFGTISHTITAGRALVVKLVVDGSSQDNLWFAYDTTTYQARLEFPAG